MRKVAVVYTTKTGETGRMAEVIAAGAKTAGGEAELFKMEELEEMLDPKDFYRLNRSYIIHINAIEEVLVYSNSRLKVLPKVKFDQEMIVSRDKVSNFKDWLSGSN